MFFLKYMCVYAYTQTQQKNKHVQESKRSKMLTSGGKEFTGILYPILILATLFLNKKFLKLKKCKCLLTQNFHFQGK